MKLKRVLCVAVLIMLIVCAVSLDVRREVVSVDDAGYQIEGNVGQLEENMIVEYRYKASGNVVSGYQMYFATYGKEIENGTIYLEIYDADTNDMLVSSTVNAEEICDNEPTIIETEQFDTGKRNIRLVVYGEGFDEDRRVTLWLGTTKKTEDGTTMINGLGQKNNLLVFERKVTSEATYTWDCILVTSICFVLFCCVPGKNKEEQPGGSDELEEKTA